MAEKSSAKPAICIFLISLLGIPIAYFVNTAQTLIGEAGLLVSGTISLLLLCILTYFTLNSFKQPKDWLFYVFSLCTFSSCVDILIWLETDGYILGFMTHYLKNGEPYLATAHGSMICLWDGSAHYLLYVVMLACMANGFDYHYIGLYWVGSIGHSMLVLVPGAILGQTGARWSFFLNIPFICIPLFSGMRFLSQKRQPPRSSKFKSSDVVISQRPLDICLILLLIASTGVAFFRGFAAIGGSPSVLKNYVDHVEPYLKDPVLFPKVQMLVYMYYFVPFYVAAIYALLRPGCSWMLDWCFICAGAAAQSQMPHILSSFHFLTPAEYHVPADARVIFWTVNLLLLVCPHVLLLRCWLRPSRFYEKGKVKD